MMRLNQAQQQAILYKIIKSDNVVWIAPDVHRHNNKIRDLENINRLEDAIIYVDESETLCARREVMTKYQSVEVTKR